MSYSLMTKKGFLNKLKKHKIFPGGSVVKTPPANAGNMGLIPDPGRSHMSWSKKPVCHNLRNCSRSQEPQLLKPARPRANALPQEKSLQ